MLLLIKTARKSGGATAAMVVSDTCPGGSAHPDQRHGHTRHGTQPHQDQACVAHGALRLWTTAWRPSSACGGHSCGARASRCAGVAGPSVSVSRGSGPGWWHACRPVPRPARASAQPGPQPWGGPAWQRKPTRGDASCRSTPPRQGGGAPGRPRQRMACPVGARRGERGKALWATRPLVSRAPATFPPGHSAVSPGVMPAEQQRAMTKQARKTQHIERFTPTLRQRVSRLVRATRSFAKQLAHHIGALTSFLCHYHLTRKVALPV